MGQPLLLFKVYRKLSDDKGGEPWFGSNDKGKHVIQNIQLSKDRTYYLKIDFSEIFVGSAHYSGNYEFSLIAN